MRSRLLGCLLLTALLTLPAVTLVALAPVNVEAASEPKPVTINFWNWWDGTRQPLMDKVISEFQKEYPWITVRSQIQSWADLAAGKILAAYAAGTPPEVMMARRMDIFALVDLGAIIPITDFVKRDNLDLSIFYPSEVNAFRYEGELWTLPLPTVGLNDSFYFYNREMFEEKGLNPDRPPETWSSLLEVNRKLTEKNAAGEITYLGVRAWPSQFVPFLYSNAGQFLSPDLKKVAFDGPEGMQAAEFMGDIVKMTGSLWGFVSKYDPQATGTSFISGREAIYFSNVSLMNSIIQQAVEKKRRLDWWGIGLMPHNDRNPKAKSTGVSGISYGWGYVIPKGIPKEKQEAAWLFIKFLTTDVRGTGFFSLAQGRPSPVRKFNEAPEFRKLNPNFDRLLLALQTEVPFPGLPVQKELYDTVISTFWSVVDGSKEPRELVTSAAEKAQVILDQYWAKRAGKR